MNKADIDKLLPAAYEAIRESGISENGTVDKSYRGQISSFGAAVSMGSLLSAVAFFSDKGSADIARDKLTAAILLVLKKDGTVDSSYGRLYDWANMEVKAGKETVCKERILNAAIAIKLAMNLYRLQDKTNY